RAAVSRSGRTFAQRLDCRSRLHLGAAPGRGDETHCHGPCSAGGALCAHPADPRARTADCLSGPHRGRRVALPRGGRSLPGLVPADDRATNSFAVRRGGERWRSVPPSKVQNPPHISAKRSATQSAIVLRGGSILSAPTCSTPPSR